MPRVATLLRSAEAPGVRPKISFSFCFSFSFHIRPLQGRDIIHLHSGYREATPMGSIRGNENQKQNEKQNQKQNVNVNVNVNEN